MPIRHALLALAFVAGVLVSDATAGSGFGAAQGGGGGGSSTVSVGTGLSGDGSSGSPITLDDELLDVAAVTPSANQFVGGDGSALVMRTGAQVKTSLGLATTTTDNALARFDGATGGTQDSDATLSDAELLDLTDTGGLIASFVALGTGVTASDVRLKLTSGALEVRTGDDLGGAPVIAATLIAGSADTSGWRLTPTSASVVTLWEGDGTDPAGVETFQFGTTTGWPSISTAAGAKTTPAYSFVGDLNNGWYRAAADEQGFATAGVERLLINDDGDFDLGFDGAAAPFGAELMIGTADQTSLGLTRASADTGGVLIQGYKTRGTLASAGDILTGDSLLSIHANARIAGALEEWGRIEMTTDGTIGSADRPSRWVFSNVPDGSNTLRAIWEMDQSGSLLASTDNSWDIGASGATRPRSFYAGTSFVGPNGSAATPSFQVDPGDGLFFVSSGVAVSVGGTEEMRIAASSILLGTQHLTFGASIGGETVGLIADAAGILRVSDADTGTGDLFCDDVFLGSRDANGFMFQSTGNTIVTLLEGDGTALTSGDGFVVGNAFLKTDADSASQVSYAFASDPNTGLTTIEDDAPAVVAEGQWRTVWSNSTTLPDNTATTIVTIPLASGAMVSGHLNLFILCTDGTDHQATSHQLNFTAVDKAGTLTSNATADADNVATAASAGTMATGLTIVDGTNAISLQFTANSSLTSPTITCRWVLEMSHSTAGVAVTIP